MFHQVTNIHRYKVLRQQQSEPAMDNCRQLLQTAQKRRMMFAAAGSSKSASLELERAESAADATAADSEHRRVFRLMVSPAASPGKFSEEEGSDAGGDDKENSLLLEPPSPSHASHRSQGRARTVQRCWRFSTVNIQNQIL